jgi:AcrR family transcriptional regulator
VATPARLLDAATREFAARGLDGARLADIASTAGITRPSLLHHFPTKEALYAAALERAFVALSSLVRQAIAPEGEVTPSFRARFDVLVRSFVAFAATDPEVCRLLLRTIVADDHPEARSALVAHAAPVLADVARFLEEDGRHDVRDDVPVQAALMGVIVDVLARAAAGDAVRRALWGEGDGATHALVTHALLAPPALPGAVRSLRPVRSAHALPERP